MPASTKTSTHLMLNMKQLKRTSKARLMRVGVSFELDTTTVDFQAGQPIALPSKSF
jgi:hypothetical protein